MTRESGQALIELVAIAPVVALSVIGTGWILRETNRRTECSRLVFEAVRSRLEGDRGTRFLLRGGILRDGKDGVEGELRCGPHVETLFLPKIDRRKAGASRFRSSF